MWQRHYGLLLNTTEIHDDMNNKQIEYTLKNREIQVY